MTRNTSSVPRWPAITRVHTFPINLEAPRERVHERAVQRAVYHLLRPDPVGVLLAEGHVSAWYRSGESGGERLLHLQGHLSTRWDLSPQVFGSDVDRQLGAGVPDAGLERGRAGDNDQEEERADGADHAVDWGWGTAIDGDDGPKR